MKPLPLLDDRRLSSLKPGQPFYGAPVGILVFERPDAPFIRPFIPGSVGNASTWSVPVRYKAVPRLRFDQLLRPDAEEMTPMVIQAAAELAADGAQLITSNCGFMIRYQEALRTALDVPVLLSSLLLAPFLARMLPRGKVLGIITASGSNLTKPLLQAAGLSADCERVVIAGLEHAPSFAAAWIRCNDHLDVDAVEAETVEAATALMSGRPDVGMLLLECSELPPFAAAVQRAIGIPVFDFTSMVEFFVAGLMRRPFNGLY